MRLASGAVFAWLLAAQGIVEASDVTSASVSASARARVQKPARCPDACASYDSQSWFVYSGMSRVTACNETMLLDFNIHNALNDSQRHSTIRTCTTGDLDTLSTNSAASTIAKQSAVSFQIGSSGSDATGTAQARSKASSVLEDVQKFLQGSPQQGQLFGMSGQAVVGVFLGGSLQDAENVKFAVQEAIQSVASGSQTSGAIQYCGVDSNHTMGVAFNLQGDLSAVQAQVLQWSESQCISDFDMTNKTDGSLWVTPFVPATSSLSNSTVTTRGLHRRTSTCSYVQVVSGDSCATLVDECGITDDEFYDYNTASDLCSTLAVGQYVCCSSGDLPDFAPTVSANGTCSTYYVQSGDSCSALAAAYSLTVDDIDDFNDETWGWYGCDDLQAGQTICLSNGTAPYPEAIANAVAVLRCLVLTSPVPMVQLTGLSSILAHSMPVVMSGVTSTGAPGTAASGSNGCISNCGTTITNWANAPKTYATVGYFEGSNVNRTCLRMNAYTINQAKYTHVHYGFGIIDTDFSVTSGPNPDQFEYFTELGGVKKIVSFGGWDFSTDADTYMIFREGVTADNRDTLATNVADFVTSNDLDGVDFDWEYPGEPDIPGIPAGSDEDGDNYLAFLKVVREKLGTDKIISIAAPASYWYLKAFPISEISEVVDYIIYMTYDLHGTWDLGDSSAQSGCTAGDCLFSHVNLTETMYSLAMITKAGVATNSVMVGVASYGRSFEMTTEGCTESDCTWDAGGAAGPCTATTGYISNAEINQILEDNDSAEWLFDSASDSDILVYNETQWVGYMTNTTLSTRRTYYETFNFAGTTEWAIDLEEYELFGIEDLSIKEVTTSSDDVSTNTLTCTRILVNENTTAELNEILDAAISYIDDVLTLYEDDPEDWDFYVLGQKLNDACTDFPTGGCPIPEPGWCSDPAYAFTVDQYWAQWVVYTFSANLIQWYAAFGATGAVDTLQIGSIVDAFTPTSSSTWSMLNFIDSLTTAMDFGSQFLSEVPGYDEADTATGIVDTNVDDLASWLGSSTGPTLPTSSDIATILKNTMADMYTRVSTNLADVNDGVFSTTGGGGYLPESQVDGPYIHNVSNYLYNLRPLFVIDDLEWISAQTQINQTLQQSLVNAALGGADYYIMKNSMTLKKCTGVSDFIIDGNCYSIGVPTSGTCHVGMGKAATASSDVIAAIESYGINITTGLIPISEACQAATKSWYGSMASDVISIVTGSTSYPQCFFNLPVITANETPTDFSSDYGSGNSPCLISDYNVTVPDTLPSNLEEWFSPEYCICGGAAIIKCKRDWLGRRNPLVC
ncbi:hypothetical protein N7540_010684 [Penicillium herquei]|nr:hypothetical protein N7540_010684 [Penicillium herquei]